MNLLLLGVNHRTAAIDDREALAFTPAQALDLLAGLAPNGVISEIALLSTCNRTEFYAAANDLALADRRVRDAVEGVRGHDLLGPGPHRYVQSGVDVAAHLFRVASGLDSMVLGDVQILGQVKDAYRLARQAGTAGPLLDRLFETALHAGKRARAETSIGTGTVSVSSAAVGMAAHGSVARAHGHTNCPRHEGFATGLRGRRLVIVGAGETARLAALHARDHAPASILIVNRTGARGAALAAEVRGIHWPLDRLPEALQLADVVFSATHAPGALIGADVVRTAMHARAGRPLLIFDLAVPRDVDPAAAHVPGVLLHAIDDVRSVVDGHLADRSAQVPRVEQIVSEEAGRFATWARGLRATSTVVALRDHFERVRLEELQRLMPHASEEERSRADRLTRALINRLLHTPTVTLKDADLDSDDGRWRLRAARDLFALGAPARTRTRGRDA
jgi:glutamyl-tRNA reductase